MHKVNLTKRIKCFKYLVYSYIVFLTITGIAQITIGTSLLWGNIGYYGILKNKLWSPSVILLSLGPLTLILCWMGFQATYQKKRCLLGLFSALLISCICIQFFTCVWALSLREHLPTSIELHVDDSFVEFLDTFSRTKVDNLHIWNVMQSQLHCCGVDGPLDYRRLSLPWSCCSRAKHAYESVCDTHYKRGCLTVLSEQIHVRLLLTSLSAAVIAFIQSIGLFCTIHLTVLFGKQINGFDVNRIISRQQFFPLSVKDKHNEKSSTPSLSPSAAGHILMKTAPSAISK